MTRRLDLRVGTRNVTRWAPAVAVAVAALAVGCDGGPRPEPFPEVTVPPVVRGPEAQVDVLGAEVTAIEVTVDGATVPCVIAASGYDGSPAITCDWSDR